MRGEVCWYRLVSNVTRDIILQKALAETRRLIRGLRPAVLDESGLVAAVESLLSEIEEKGAIKTEFSYDVSFNRLAPFFENSFFRIVQESLTNAERYSGTDKIHVRLVQAAGRLNLDVQDWGCGFDVEQVASGGFGLKGIRERASLLGGEATIDSTPGKGTRIHVELPLNGQDKD